METDTKTADKTKPKNASSNGKASETEPLLKLNTLAPDRPFAEIDDVRHDFRLIQEFGSLEHQAFTRDSRRYDELWTTAKQLSKSDEKLIVQLLDRLWPKTLVDPAALQEQLGKGLTGAIKRELLLTFTNAPLLMAMAHETTELETRESSTTES